MHHNILQSSVKKEELYKILADESTESLQKIRIFCDQLILSNNYRGLNEVDRKCLLLLKQGESVIDISKQLFLTRSTIDKRLRTLRRKFKVKTINQLRTL